MSQHETSISETTPGKLGFFEEEKQNEIEELEIQVVERLEEKFTLWIYRGSDWIDTDTAEMLTGYTPSEKEYNYQRRIRKLHDLN